MGHVVEYIIDLPSARAAEWLTYLDGRWAATESPAEMPWVRFAWDDQILYASLGRFACHLSVPCIKYSWLIAGDAQSAEWVARFERYLAEVLPGVRGVRLDELVRINWEASTGREWSDIPDPVASVRTWLSSHEDGPEHHRFLSA